MKRFVDLDELNLIRKEGTRTKVGDMVYETGVIDGLALCYGMTMQIDGDLEPFIAGDGLNLDVGISGELASVMELRHPEQFRFALCSGELRDGACESGPKEFYFRHPDQAECVMLVAVFDGTEEDVLPQGDNNEFCRAHSVIFHAHGDKTENGDGYEAWILTELDLFQSVLEQMKHYWNQSKESGDLIALGRMHSEQIFYDLVRTHLVPRFQKLSEYRLELRVDYMVLYQKNEHDQERPCGVYRYTHKDILLVQSVLHWLERGYDYSDLLSSEA